MQNDRTSAEYQQWRQDVRQRDGNACRRCGFDTNLEVHHIKPLVKYPEFATELHNGLTLCGNCHSLLRGREETTDLLKFIEASPYSRDEQIIGHLMAMMSEQLEALNDRFAELTHRKAQVLIGNDSFIEPGHIQAEMLRLEAEEKLREAERLRREADDVVKKRQREAEQKRQREMEEKHQQAVEERRRREAEQKRQREAKKQQQRKAKEELREAKQQTSIGDFQEGNSEHLSDNRASTQAKKKKNSGKAKNTKKTSHRKQLKQIRSSTIQRSSAKGRWQFRPKAGRNISKTAKRRRAKKLDLKQGPIALKQDPTTLKQGPTALKQLELHAKKGDAAAQYNLGWRYEYGEGVVQDKREAAKWYRKAAEQGYPAATRNKFTKRH